MTRKAFVHVGLPKTGTTYLQGILWANKDRLAEHGLLLPGRRRRVHLLASLDVREDPKLARRPGDVGSPWQDLVEECREWPGNVLISHEFFAAASPPQIRRMADSLAGFETHVVLTARPMTELGPSRWQEWVKSGGTLAVDEYPLDRDYDPTNEWGWGSFDLGDILERWSQVVPAPHIHVLPVDRSAPPDDLWHRFAEVLGLQGADFEVPQRPANPSLGVVEIELLRRVNGHLHDFQSAPDRGNWIRRYLAEGRILPAQSERFRVGEDRQKELVDRSRRAVALLAAGEFDVRGCRDMLEPTEPGAVRHPSQVTDSELLASATVAMANMLRSVRALNSELDSLRSRQAVEAAGVPARGFWRAPLRTLRRLMRGRQG